MRQHAAENGGDGNTLGAWRWFSAFAGFKISSKYIVGSMGMHLVSQACTPFANYQSCFPLESLRLCLPLPPCLLPSLPPSLCLSLSLSVSLSLSLSRSLSLPFCACRLATFECAAMPRPCMGSLKGWASLGALVALSWGA